MNSKSGSPPDKRFHFKQFSLSDQGCAMKIGTDGVLLGSVAANYQASRALDIGTGCGLIALMLAQETKANITALDPEAGAFTMALKNVAESPWPDRIVVLKERFQDFAASVPGTFELIVCNPPYFRNSLQSPDQKRNQARHDDSLPAEDLFKGVSKIISPEGIFLIIVPAEQESEMEILAKKLGMKSRRKILVRPNPGQNPKRIIMAFSPAPGAMLTEALSIETGQRHAYSQAYQALTKNFYLDF
ncbi:MAG: methyltransferase [Bacteroides sp.]|jgi:tRNA1Val (adenine37-N6)-methyltransferase|nr:methyltransferase [Bacteroides sp.]